MHEGVWLVSSPRNPQPLEGKVLLFALPLLETRYSDVIGCLRDAILREGLTPALIDSFPASGLVKFALEMPSEYWKTRAIEWLEEMPADPILDGFLASLKKKRRLPSGLQKRAGNVLRMRRVRARR